MSHDSHLTRQLLAILSQGRRLLEEIGEDTYRKCPEPIATSSIGAHFRHVLDALACFCDGVPAGSVDYDGREREEAVELSPALAVERLDALAERIRGLEGAGDRPVRARSDVPAEVGPEEGWNGSSVGRETLFALSHTIHHFALIAILLRYLGGEPPEGFGVAPSTLRYWEEVGRCAPLAG